jgi:hypothetical protein
MGTDGVDYDLVSRLCHSSMWDVEAWAEWRSVATLEVGRPARVYVAGSPARGRGSWSPVSTRDHSVPGEDMCRSLPGKAYEYPSVALQESWTH